MSGTVVAARAARLREAPLASPSRSLSLGYLAMLPLLVAYEAAVASEPASPRNWGELVLGLVLRPLGASADIGRWAGLALCAVLAFGIAKRRDARIGAGVARIVLEGIAAAAVLGPLMVIAVRSLDGLVPALDVSWDPTAAPPGLVDTALVFGAGAWEELLFRVGAYSFVYWLALRFATALGRSEPFSRGFADLSGLALSSLAFALAHFDPFHRWLGLSARPFDGGLFAWLCLGGALLGVLFRWRGPGVAAWAHGLFNVLLWIGVDPDVLW
jgi:membrane protease YdiL (CAAX protease family)